MPPPALSFFLSPHINAHQVALLIISTVDMKIEIKQTYENEKAFLGPPGLRRIALPNFSAYLNAECLASFEDLTIENECTLEIRHFALVNGRYGEGLGELCIRAFAKKIMCEYNDIQHVKFELSSTSVDEDKVIREIAEARVELLKTKLGIGDVVKHIETSNGRRPFIKVTGSCHISTLL